MNIDVNERSDTLSAAALQDMENLIRGGPVFASSLDKGTLDLLRQAIWPYSRRVEGLNWQLVNYVLHQWAIAVQPTDTHRGAFLSADYEPFGDNLYFKVTMEEGREDPIMVHVIRLVD